MSIPLPPGYNLIKVTEYLTNQDEKALKRYVRGYFAKGETSLPKFLLDHGAQVNTCAFCGRLVTPEFSLGKDDLGQLAFIETHQGHYPFMCSNKDCASRKLNPNSVERVSKGLGLSEAEALHLIHARNKSPFYRENHSSDEEYTKAQTRGLDFFTMVYGHEGEIHQREMAAKISYKNSKERYLAEDKLDEYERISAQKAITVENLARLYSTDEAKRRVAQWKDRVKETKANFIRRYGEEDGTKKYEEFLLKRSKNMSLSGFVEKYGEAEGKARYLARCEKASWSYDVAVKKYGKDLGDKKYREFLFRIGPMNVAKNGISRESWVFFGPVLKRCFQLGLVKDDIKIGTQKRKEFWLSKKGFGFFCYDFCIPRLKIIVEYNGEGFHPNPSWPKEKWDSWRQVFTGALADDVQAKYDQKVNLCKEYGYTLIQVFSSDPFDRRRDEICSLIESRLKELP